MAIASLSFAAAVPVYTSIGSNGTFYGGSSVAVKGDVAISTSGSGPFNNSPSVLTSNLTSNGLNYSPINTFVSGNKLTVYYNLDGNTNANAATDTTAQQTLQAGEQSTALNSGIYGTGVTITPEGSQTNGNVKVTSYEITLNGPLNGVYGSINRQSGYSVSDSSDGSSLSISSIGTLGNGLKVTYQLADGPPATQPAPSSTPETGNLTPQLKNAATLGDLLASSSGITFAGTLAGALHATNVNEATGSSPTGSTLASVLSSGTALSPSTSAQVTDFINTSSDAYPTSAPAAPPTSSSSSFGSQSNNNDNSSNQNSQSSGVYNAFASVGTSTIRGSNLNTVA